MAAFVTVNTELSPPATEQTGNERTPTTPKVSTTSAQQVAREAMNAVQEPRAPVQQTSDGLAGQQPLPEEGLPSPQNNEPAQHEHQGVKRAGSHQVEELNDVEMGEGEENPADEEDASDNESVTSDSQRPSKKKKGQRFFCTEFPPCTLSFTRSEHLARHIRKHTGERPFVCHCSRRFSRLDNLRQHAQTVHVNEEIPTDSLAATSTRFQRQIRTDRVRPSGGRSRANTLGSSGGGHSRGHSRNLSASSVGSNTSSVGIPEDTRRRPQPIAIANDPSARARLAIDTYSNVATSPQYAYYNQSPTGYSTPTSTTFSTGPESPRFGSNIASPASTISRSSFYNGARHGRRLSVPSTQLQYQNQGGNMYAQPVYFSPLPSGSSANFSQNGSVFGSPTSSVFSLGRRDSEAELDYRRRTWHSGTYGNYAQRPATSGLSYHQTPDDQRPAFSGQPAASQVTRLPGIESFDHAPPPNARQPTSPIAMATSPRPPSSGRPSDAGLHQNLTRLDITAANVPAEAQWQQQPPQHQGAQPVYVQQQQHPQQPATIAPQSMHQHSVSMPEPITPRKNKRQGWYGGPITPTNVVHSMQRPSPEDSGSSDGVPTPGTSQGAEYHPVIVNPSEQYPHHQQHAPAGMAADEQQPQQQKVHYSTSKPKPEPARTDSGYQPYGQPPPPQQTYALQHGEQDARYPPRQQASSDMSGLEALVAAAERS